MSNEGTVYTSLKICRVAVELLHCCTLKIARERVFGASIDTINRIF